MGAAKNVDQLRPDELCLTEEPSTSDIATLQAPGLPLIPNIQDSVANDALAALQLEIIEEALARYKDHYQKWDPSLKSRCTWEEVERRLLANNKKYLQLANALNEGGVLFGIDESNNLLFADAGGPIMQEKTYNGARKAVCFRQGHENDQTLTGYQLFRYDGLYLKSKEIEMFEAFTQKPIVGPGTFLIWLESGKNPQWGHVAVYNNAHKQVFVTALSAQTSRCDLGVRRLLKVPPLPIIPSMPATKSAIVRKSR